MATGLPPTPEVPARAFRVVCDNMLQGLARCLRCLGADVRVLGLGEDHREAAEVSARRTASSHRGWEQACVPTRSRSCVCGRQRAVVSLSLAALPHPGETLLALLLAFLHDH